MNAEKLAHRIAEFVLEKKGQDVLLQDLRGVTTMTDFFILCTVEVDVQAKAIIDHVTRELKKENIKPWHTEGQPGSNWILMDFVDVVLHIFTPRTREYYALEKLWGDARLIEIKDEDETTGTY